MDYQARKQQLITRRRFLVGSLALGASSLFSLPTWQTLSSPVVSAGVSTPLVRSRNWSGEDFAHGLLVNARVDRSGLHLVDPKLPGLFVSETVSMTSGFNAAVLVWRDNLILENNSRQEGNIKLSIRSGASQEALGEWSSLHLHHDWLVPGDDEKVSQLVIVPDTVIHNVVQISALIESGMASSSPTLSTVRLVLINSLSGFEYSVQQRIELFGNGYPKPPVVPRTEWCTSPDCDYSDGLHYETVTHLIVHHTVTSNGATNWPAVVRAIWAFHTYDRGWGDIGYNYLVDQDGHIYEGHLGGDDVIGTHAGGANAGSMGVALLGTFTRPDQSPPGIMPPMTMQDALVELLAWKADQRSIDVFDASQLPNMNWGTPHLAGHRDVYGTTVCPGDLAHDVLSMIRQRVATAIDATVIHQYIDELSAEFIKSNANWYDGPLQCGFDGHAWYTYSTTDPAHSTNWAEWRPSLAVSGQYELEIYVPFCNTGSPETTEAPYEVHHATGVASIPINQSNNLGRWVTLGTFDFEAGNSGYVRLSDLTTSDSGSIIWFDAIRMRYLAPIINSETPSYDEWLLSRTVSFRWNLSNVAGVNETGIEVAETPDFAFLLFSAAWPGSQTAVQHEFLEDHPDLYWRIRLTLADGTEVLSDSWRFHIDTEPPTSFVSSVNLLPAGYYVVSWQGTDTSSGIAAYGIEYRAENNAQWLPLINDTSQTSTQFEAPQPDTVYWFRSRATDNVGWVEPEHSGPGDTSTQDATILDKQLALPIIHKD